MTDTLAPTPLDADESALVAELRAGSEAAFARLVHVHGGRLLAVIRRFLPGEADAQDALQDAFLSAFRGIDGFDGKSLLATWLHRIAVNAALSRLRAARRRPEQPIDALLPRFLDDGHQAEPAVEWRDGPDVLLQREESRALVRACIDQLPESYRTILLLRDIEEVDTEETARLLGTSVAAVKTRLHRARQALRALLDPHLRRGAL
jgi:RNA polymerase sigma-70 factor (ECF subfamily)